MTAMDLEIDYRRMERALRGHATRAQQAMLNITTRLKIRASLQIVRGQVVQELLRAAENADLFILGKGQEARGEYIGAIARQVVQRVRGSVLLVNKNLQRYTSVMTVFTGNDRSAQVLNAAAQLARAEHKTLLILIPCANTADFQQRREQSRLCLGSGPLVLTYQAVPNFETCLDPGLLRAEGVGVVAINGGLTAVSFMEIRLAELECSLLLVR